MRPAILKVIIRVLASLAGLIGLSMLFFALVLHLPDGLRSRDEFSIGFSLFSILLGIYLSGVGFLSWVRLSPEAGRHVLGIPFLFLFGTLGRAWDHLRSVSPELSVIAFLLGALLFYAIYRCVASYFCNRLFPHDPDPEARNA